MQQSEEAALIYRILDETSASFEAKGFSVGKTSRGDYGYWMFRPSDEPGNVFFSELTLWVQVGPSGRPHGFIGHDIFDRKLAGDKLEVPFPFEGGRFVGQRHDETLGDALSRMMLSAIQSRRKLLVEIGFMEPTGERP